jgi:chemotaxis protein methyltransferase CheR
MDIEQFRYTIKPEEYKLFQKFIHEKAGIYLSDEKEVLLVSRLSKRLKELGLKDFSAYYKLLNTPEGSAELIQMINRVTTNKTDFFRENHHFDFLLTKVFPHYRESGKTNIRIWSAGCSTGEEPYTLAMITASFFGETPREDIKILATDLDTSVLQHAGQGLYLNDKIEPVPPEYRDRYLSRKDKLTWEIKPSIKKFITFRRLNLIRDNFPFKYGFDIIFCRNVIIYFTKEDKQNFVARASTVLRPQGYLFLGHSESLLNEHQGFKPVFSTAYQKP